MFKFLNSLIAILIFITKHIRVLLSLKIFVTLIYLAHFEILKINFKFPDTKLNN